MKDNVQSDVEAIAADSGFICEELVLLNKRIKKTNKLLEKKMKKDDEFRKKLLKKLDVIISYGTNDD